LAREASPPGPIGAVPSLKTEAKFDASTAKAIPSAIKSKGKRKREGLLGVVKKKPATEALQAKDEPAKKPNGD
jgi:hypothetical protein